MFEYGRKLICPDRPSRLNCVFALNSLEDAYAYRNKTNITQLIYRVDAVESEFKTHIGSYSIVTRPYVNDFIAEMQKQVSDYWSDVEKEDIEILIDCSVMVVEGPL